MLRSVPVSEFYECGAIISQRSGKCRIAWGPRTWVEAMPERSPSAWYAPDFFLKDPKPWFTHSNEQELSLNELKTLIQQPTTNEKSTWSQPYEQHFRQACQELQDQIRNQCLRKGVPYVIESSSSLMTSKLLTRTLHRLIDYAQKLPVTIYGFWEKGQGMIGATPEVLFRINPDTPGVIQTDAVAGTTHRHGQKQLMSDPKEREEHQIVIEGIQSSLNKFGKVRVGETSIVSLGTLGHLKTPIQVDLQTQPTFQEIVQALHPTPALGAYPKQQGLAWLQQYQNKIDRRRYGAPFGYTNPEGIAECLVAIRNVQWNAQGMKIGAGCGVVEHSNIDQEWAEIQAKIAAIKELLGL